jgi:hypothetical protein
MPTRRIAGFRERWVLAAAFGRVSSGKRVDTIERFINHDITKE